MRRALASTHISSGGGSLPSASPMSASAPDTGVLGGLHTAQYHASPYGHSGLSRSASEKPASNSRSRSTLGLTSRSISNRSSGSSGNGTFVGDNGNGTGLSTTSTATTVYSPSASPLSVHNDDTLASCAVDLSPERRKMLVDFVDRSVDDAYNLCHGFGSIRWHPAKTREGVSIYRAKGGEMSDDPRLDASVRGKCNVSASFDEMMDTLITETTADFVAHESSVNPAEFLDGQVLCTLVPRTRGDRFVCVKWHCIKSLAPSVAKHRDYVYVEVVDHFTDRDGRKVGFRLSKSVELDELRAFDNSAIFVRGKTLALHTFSQISPGNVELYTMMINDLGERLPPWLVAKIVDTAAMRSACLRDFINQKRMDLMVLARPKEMVPLHKRVCCVVCTRSFSLVRKKYNCVACGDVICNQCSVHQFVAAPKEMISDFVGKKKARICVQCSSNAQRRELPRRASSASSSQMNPPVDKLSEMDHRRGAGSTIGQRRPQSSYYDPHGRIVRSASSAEASISSQESESSRIYPMSDRGYSNRSTIPHMFQFRPAKQAPTVIGGTSGSGGRPSGRSSGMSTSRTSSSPDDDGLLHPDQDDDEEEDDDMEYELEDHHGDGMDFDNLFDESALDRSTVSRHNGAVDLGVGKYRKSYTGPGAPGDDPGDDGEDELTDADDEDTLTAPSTGSSESTLSTNPLGDAVEDEGEELIIEEVMPQGSMDPSGQSPRQSTIRESVGDVHRVSIVKPVVIKQIRKRPAPGAPPKPEGDAALRASSCVISASEAEDDVDAFMSKRESIVTRSRRATLSDESNSKEGASGGTEGEDTIQLADLQIHLDRMTLISESLKKLHEQQQAADAPSKLRHSVSMPVRAASPSPPTLEDQFATISNIGIRAQQEAALAAGFAQAILVESANNSRSSVFVSDIHLMREDGGLCDFLADSSFVDLTASMPEGSVVVPGWVAVHSKTTGKVYYYNESCGSTSWTIPTPDTNRMTTAYMVL